MPSVYQELAAEIVAARRAADTKGAPQIIYTTIEGGAVPVRSETGTLTAIVGQQYDGTFGAFTVAGPNPPKPNPPTVEQIPGGIRVRVDGTWANALVAPMDFAFFEVYAGDRTDPDWMTWDGLRRQIPSARGGEVEVSLTRDTDFYIWVAARSAAGTLGLRSEPLGPVRAGKIAEADLSFDIGSLGGTTIFYGADTPTASALGDLWLKEIAPGKFESYRWTPGSPANSWVLVQDQGISQALADAASAASAANQAGLDALAASGTAGNAQTAAQAASDAATAASNLAAGKTTTFRQSTQPATTGRTVGDQWYDTANGGRLSVWGSNNQWNLQQFGSAAISATARQLGAITTYKQASAPTSGMIVGDFWIRSSDNRIHRYEGSTPTWVESKDVDINTAIQNAATAQSTADGKVRIFRQPTAPTGLLPTDVGDVWIDTDAGNVSSTWELVSGTTYGWVKRQLGNGAIQPQSLVASDVIATGTVSAALLEAIMVLATMIILGPQTGTHTEISPTGIRGFTEDPIDGIPNEAWRLGTSETDFLGLTDYNGMMIAGFDRQGNVVGQGMNIQGDPIFQGVPLSQRFTQTSGGSGVGFFRQFLAGPLGPIKSELGVMEATGYLTAGRSYLIKAHFSWFQNIPNLEAEFRIRSTRPTTEGGDSALAPTLTSTTEEVWWRTFPGYNRSYTEDFELLYVCTRTGQHRFMLTAGVNDNMPLNSSSECNGELLITPSAPNTPTGVVVKFPWQYDGPPRVFTSVNSGSPGTGVTGVSAGTIDAFGFTYYLTRTNVAATTCYWQAVGNANGAGRITIDNQRLTSMVIQDAGPSNVATGQQTAGGGTVAAGGAQPASPVAVKQQYTKTLNSVGTDSWKPDGTTRSTVVENDVSQGSRTGVGDRGMYRFNLPDITGTVDSVEVYLNAWYWDNAYKWGEAVVNITDWTGSDPAFVKLQPTDLLVEGFPQPGGQWFILPTDWWPKFKGVGNTPKNGRAMAITLGPGDPANDYSAGHFNKCILRIKYTQ